MTVHRIRLGSAWQLAVRSIEDLAHPPDQAPGRTVQLPALGAILPQNPAIASVELRRFFNRPSGLEPGTEVRLTFTGLTRGARVILNESVVGEIPESGSNWTEFASFDVRDTLRPHNELVIAFPLVEKRRQPEEILLAMVSLDIESGP